jgi:hypothetical protein
MMPETSDAADNDALVGQANAQLARVELEEHLNRANQAVGGPNEQSRAASFRHLLGIYRGQLKTQRLAQEAAREAYEQEMQVADARRREGEDPQVIADVIASIHKLRDARLAAARVDFRLEDFFQAVARRVWGSDDPAAMVKALVGNEKRGPPVKNSDRDFDIAVSVERRRQEGLSAEEACGQIADCEGLSFERIASIYKGFDRRELKAEAAFIREQIDLGR